MDSNHLYLDTNIFLAYVHSSHKFHNIVKKCIKNLETMDIVFCFSEWNLLEMIRVLIKDYSYEKKQAEKIADSFRKKKKIGNLNLILIEVNKKEFDIDSFLSYLHNRLLEFKNFHLNDAIHELIMHCNNISSILTTDPDFNVLKETIIVISPEVFAKFKSKKSPSISS